AAERYLQKFVFVAARKLPVHKTLDQTLDGRSQSIGFLREHPVVRKAIRQINAVDFARTQVVWSIDLDFSIDPARTQNCRVNQIGAIGSEDNYNVVERIDSVHLRAEHRHKRRK